MWKYKMKRNSKLAILIVLVTTAILVWIPKGKEANDVSSPALSASVNQAIPMITVVPRKRTKFIEWERNPFKKLQTEKEQKNVGNSPDLRLGAIMWDDKNPSAFINGNFVSIGDKIDNKTIMHIFFIFLFFISLLFIIRSQLIMF